MTAEETPVAEIPISQQAETTKVVEETSPAVVVEEPVKIADGDVDAKKEDEPKTEEVEEKKVEAVTKAGAEDAVSVVSKSSSFKEESNLLSDLKDYQKKALIELKSKLEEAILENKLFKEEAKKEEEKPTEESKEEEKPTEEEAAKKEEKPVEEKPAEEEKKEEEKPVPTEAEAKEKSAQEEGEADKEKPTQEAEEEKKPEVGTEEKAVEVDRDISIWGIPLLPSKGAEGTDVILLKFLRARDFKVNDAFVMLKNALQWRKKHKIDSILDEDLGSELNSVAYMNDVDREGHPVCYNIYGAFQNEELYQNTFGTKEKRNQFLRWRFQLMEKGIQELDFKQGGVSSLLQIIDLKNSPGPSKKELRNATKQAVGLLQDNYPEFVARNIFLNVPFWYYAFNALLSPFLTQRTKSKFVFARTSKGAETLLKYIPAENIPIQYGGLKRENDSEFSVEDGSVSELLVKSGGTETIEIHVPEVGTTALWDLTVLGWEVTYKEEFVPDDEGSYTVIIQKGKKISAKEEPVRNSFRNNESGKIVLTIENASYKKKKRVLYRFKTEKSN